MKKLIAVFSALIICLTLGINAYADILGPIFSVKSVEVVNPEGAAVLGDSGEVIPCGTVLDVTGEYYQDKVRIIVCKYESESTGKTERVEILGSDTRVYDLIGESTEPEATQKPSEPETVTKAPTTQAKTETTTEITTEATEQDTTEESSSEETRSSEATETKQTETTEAKEAKKPEKSINAKRVIITCATVSGLVSLMAAVTTVYIKKKKA